MRIATPKPFRSAHRAALLTACLLAMQAAFAIAEEAPGGHASVHQQQEAVATSERIMAEAKRRSGLLSTCSCAMPMPTATILPFA